MYGKQKSENYHLGAADTLVCTEITAMILSIHGFMLFILETPAYTAYSAVLHLLGILHVTYEWIN